MLILLCKSGNASAIHFKIWLILRRKRRPRTIVDNVDSSLFQQSEDRVCWSLLSYFVKCDIYMYPYIILVWDTHFLEKSGSRYTGWGTCCWCFALCKPRLLKTYWRLSCMLLKTALKTVFYAEEYHLFLVTDIYFDIFCIDCIVKSAETQTCIV